MILFPMPIPETTSAEAFDAMLAGNVCGLLAAKLGETSKPWMVAPPRIVDMLFFMPRSGATFDENTLPLG